MKNKLYWNGHRSGSLTLGLILLLMTLMPGMGEAKLKKVVKIIVADASGHLDPLFDSWTDWYSPKYYISCDGHPALITVDEKGETQVYINSDATTGECPQEERYRVVPDEEDIAEGITQIDWREVVICGGTYAPAGETVSVPSASIRMEGGHIYGLALCGESGCNSDGTSMGTSDVTGEAHLVVNGGMVHEITISNSENTISGQAYVELNRLTYIGINPITINDRGARTTLFMGPECHFVFSKALMSANSVYDCTGVLAKVAGRELFLSGQVPVTQSGLHYNCTSLVDNSANLDWTQKVDIDILACDGWSCGVEGRTLKSYGGHVTKKPHVQNEFIISPASCTDSAEIFSECVNCGLSLPTTLEAAPAGGHSYVTIPAVAATCEYEGHEAYEVCERCGALKGDSIPVIKALGHYLDPFYGEICQPRSGIKYSCRRSGCKYTRSSNSGTHTTTKQIIVRKATCYSPGVMRENCTKCNVTLRVWKYNLHDSLFTTVKGNVPTCTTAGAYPYKICKEENCDLKYWVDDANSMHLFSDTAVLHRPALGHDFGGTTYQEEGTCRKGSRMRMSCSKCEDSLVYYASVLGSHHYAIDSIHPICAPYVLVDVICTTEGCGEKHQVLAGHYYQSYFETVPKYSYDDFLKQAFYSDVPKLVAYRRYPDCQREGVGIYHLALNDDDNQLEADIPFTLPVRDSIAHYDDEGYDAVHDRRIVARTFQDVSTASGLDFTTQEYLSYDSLLSAAQLSESNAVELFANLELTDYDPTPLPAQRDWHGHSVCFTDGRSYDAANERTIAPLSYVRNFTATAWQALYVPFSLSVEALAERGLTVARLNDTHMYDRDDDGLFEEVTLEFVRLARGTTRPNYPYLIKANTIGEVSVPLDSVSVKGAEVTTISCSTIDQNFSFTGTYEGVPGAQMVAGNFYALGNAGLARVSKASLSLRPQRWYMVMSNKDGSAVEYYAPVMRLSIDGQFEDEATGAQQLEAPAAQSLLYDLQGRRIEAAEQIDRGLYVKRGKKIIVR